MQHNRVHVTRRKHTDNNRDRESGTTKATTMMLTTCASCVVVSSHRNQNGKSKRRPFPPQRSNLSTLTNKNARRLRHSPFNKTHNALAEDDENNDRSAENILEKMPKKLEPPQRDTGIPSELDINIDIDEGTIFRVFGFCVGVL